MKLLIYGDVVGKLGRAGVKLTLPKWREKFAPDVVIANVENIAHGKGIGISQIEELKNAGVQIFTGGNHSIEGKDAGKILGDETIPILRPANMSPNIPGRGTLLFDVKLGKSETAGNETTKAQILRDLAQRDGASRAIRQQADMRVGAKSGAETLLAINLIGQVHMRQNFDSPFHAVDKILAEYGDKTSYKIVDWHAEATSEKVVMGHYLDGKVSAIFGTHTHVPTADAKILPRGTAYISDIGMVGPFYSIIGVEIGPAFKRFRDQIHAPMDVVEAGPIEVNATFIELDDNGLAVDIKHLREIITEYKI